MCYRVASKWSLEAEAALRWFLGTLAFKGSENCHSRVFAELAVFLSNVAAGT